MRLQCHTPEQTQLYERGYPQMAILVDGHADDKKPAASVAKIYKQYFGKYHVRWPRLVAHAFVRAAAVVDDDDWESDAAVKAASSPGLVSADEARSIVQTYLACETHDDLNQVFHVMFALEAIAGTDVVLGAIVDGLEALPKKRWNAKDPNAGGVDQSPALMAYATGFMLLRTAKAKDFAKRLEALYEATVKAKVAPGEETLRGGLDLALHGTDGAKRTLANSHWQYWYYYLNCEDAAVHLARLADNDKSDWVPEARILYLAGAELLPIYTSKKALRNGKRLPNFLGDFGMFADDRILSLMVDMIGVKTAGDAPRDYFRDNAVHVRAKLDKLARGSGATAVKAKAALALAK